MADIITAGMTGAQYRANINGLATPYTYNVKSYGATGNGTTNDTAAIQAAIDACEAGGGGTLYIPEGIYLANTLDITSVVKIIGDGSVSVLKSAAAEPLLRCQNAVSGEYQNYLCISNLFLDGNEVGTHGLYLKRIIRFLITNVQIEDFVTYGVYADGLLIGKFDSLFVNNCSTGFYNKKSAEVMDLAPNQITFQDCIFIYNAVWGIYYRDGFNIKLIGCALEWNGTSGNADTGAIHFYNVQAYSTHYGQGLHLYGCWFEYNNGTVVKITNTDNNAGLISSINSTLFIVNTMEVTINVVSDIGPNKLMLRDSSIQDATALKTDGAAAVIVNDQSYVGGTITQNDSSKYYMVDITEVT